MHNHGTNNEDTTLIDDDDDHAPLPPYLARHMNLGFDSDDVNALITSIDSSQKSLPRSWSAPVSLPAEILLEILEHVPVDYILDWRLVCRGFRTAIDGRIMYQYLQRAELICYAGTIGTGLMERISDEDYDRLCLMRLRFQGMKESGNYGTPGAPARKPAWNNSHAVFRMDEDWLREFSDACRLNTFYGMDLWLYIERRLIWMLVGHGLGELQWCIRLDHAVLDLKYPLHDGHVPDKFDFDLDGWGIVIAWDDMLRGFLKTEAALRRLIGQTEKSNFSYSHVEDCLRSIRRRRFQSNLDPQYKEDRSLIWALAMLPPLFGKNRPKYTSPLEDVEDQAIALLLLLRREASLTTSQVVYLKQLAADNETMEREMCVLEATFREFQDHLAMSGVHWRMSEPILKGPELPCNPIAWTDDIIADVEARRNKWRSQKRVLDQMKLLLTSSNMAMALPEDSFENMDSDF